MSEKSQEQSFREGLSMIVFSENRSGNLERFLASFFKHNSYHPHELLVVDCAGSDAAAAIIAQYQSCSFIMPLKPKSAKALNFPQACNYGALEALYPNLLFCADSLRFSGDIIPVAMEKLTDPLCGAVGVRLDDAAQAGAQDVQAEVRHAGITFSAGDVLPSSRIIVPGGRILADPARSGIFHALSGPFFLCRREDYHAVGGLCEEYASDAAVTDFCLQLQAQLGKKSFSINTLPQLLAGDASLAESTAATGGCSHEAEPGVRLFQKRVGNLVKKLTADWRKRSVGDSRKAGRLSPLRILYVLPSSLQHKNIYQVKNLVKRMRPHGIEALAAVPEYSDLPGDDFTGGLIVQTYEQTLQKGPTFSDGKGPDLIHAWSPNEEVHRFVRALEQNISCPLVIHLDENLDYVAENHSAEQAEHDDRPQRVKDWLAEALALTMTNRSLERYKGQHQASLILPPLVDEAQFYPRPIDYALRRRLGIPADHVVLAYTGGMHEANRHAVLALYEATALLRDEGLSCTLLRCGENKTPLFAGDRSRLETAEQALGLLDHSKTAEVAAAADILVQPGMPGSYDDFRIPVKLPEYFALGRPVVLSAAFPDLDLEHGFEAYLLEEGSAQEIAAAVKTIASDQALSARLAQGATEAYLKKFTHPRAGQSLYDFYQRIIDESLAAAQQIETSPATASSAAAAGRDPSLDPAALKAACDAATPDPSAPAQPPALPALVSPQWDELVQDLQEKLHADIVVVSCLESAIVTNALPVDKPWVGFIHAVPVKLPNWLVGQEPYPRFISNALFKTKAWKQSKPNCMGLIAFSEAHAKRPGLQKVEIPVWKVPYPLPQIKQKWTPQAYEANPAKKIIQVDWWLQRVHGLHILPTEGLEKQWIRRASPELARIMAVEAEHLKERYILFDFMLDSVAVADYPSDEAYFKLLRENIVFTHYYDANTLKLLADCIACHTPILINAFPAFREILGNDYPLYYYYYQDAAEKASDSKIIRKAHRHLADLAKNSRTDLRNVVDILDHNRGGQ